MPSGHPRLGLSCREQMSGSHVCGGDPEGSAPPSPGLGGRCVGRGRGSSGPTQRPLPGPGSGVFLSFGQRALPKLKTCQCPEQSLDRSWWPSGGDNVRDSLSVSEGEGRSQRGRTWGPRARRPPSHSESSSGRRPLLRSHRGWPPHLPSNSAFRSLPSRPHPCPVGRFTSQPHPLSLGEGPAPAHSGTAVPLRSSPRGLLGLCSWPPGACSVPG